MSKRQAAQARAAAPAKGKRKLTRAEKKQIEALIRQAKGDGKAHTAQQTIPYLQMYPDGICRGTDKKYSKSIAFEGQIGNNYLKGLFALGFQGFLIMICVGIYAVLVNDMIIADNLHSAIFSLAAYTVILCFSLFKSGTLAKSILNAH